jgi:hypothetical protein
MEKLEKVKKVVYLSFIMAGLSLLNGCVIYKEAPAELSVSQIVQMSKDGKSSKDIIQDIRHSHTVYRLKASDFANLKNEGVQDSVLNYMDKTRINSIRENESYQNYGYWGPGWGNYWYGGPGFGWPYPYLGLGYGIGPTIIIRGNGGGHHEGYGGNRRR